MSSATDSQATEDQPRRGPAPSRPSTAPPPRRPSPRRRSAPGASAEDARAIAEAARETEWGRPSFAKGLYLGSFDLGLIHPWPTAKAEDVERGEAFMERLTEFCRHHVRAR